jgi:pseudaminic acid synthase
MRETFNVVPGLSDYTLGSVVPVTSIPLGAKIIEKHIILDHNQGGLDAKFSMKPEEFGEMVKQDNAAEKAIRNVNYELSNQQKRRREITDRSLFVRKGDVLSKDNVLSVSPGYRVHPEISNVLLN